MLAVSLKDAAPAVCMVCSPLPRRGGRAATMSAHEDRAMLSPVFLSDAQAQYVQTHFGTPVFVYDEATLRQRAGEVLAFPHLNGLTARFAMKALPSAAVLQVFHSTGLYIDASSGFEADRALRAGIPAAHIQITAQELPRNLEALLAQGVRFNACSLHQLRAYGQIRPGRTVGVRINPRPGLGPQQPHQRGGALVQLRDLARTSRPGARLGAGVRPARDHHAHPHWIGK
jgi:hypothetical protein